MMASFWAALGVPAVEVNAESASLPVVVIGDPQAAASESSDPLTSLPGETNVLASGDITSLSDTNSTVDVRFYRIRIMDE
jgi:hypothetical protein